MSKPKPTYRNRIVGYGEQQADQLLANEANWRIHGKLQQDALSGVLAEVGIVQNIIVNKRLDDAWPMGQRGVETVLDGHLRTSLAITAEGRLPITYVDLSPDEEALILATLDPLSAMAAVDKEQLDALLRDVSTSDEAVMRMLADLAKESGLDYGAEPKADPGAQVDRAQELLAKWGCKRGDVWGIGHHRLMVGDSTSGEDVARLLDGAKPVLMATDPPYGVKYDSAWRAPYSSGEYSVGVVANDDRADWSDVWRLWDVPVLYVWHGGLHADIVAAGLRATGYELRGQIIWNKSVMVFGRGHYHWKHEPCWYAVKKGHTASWNGDRSQTTVWDCGNGSGAGRTDDEADDFHAQHISQKPVELFRRPMENHTKPGDACAEPFSGSGSQLVAGEQLGRTVLAMELEPSYVAVGLERLSAMGLVPELLP